MADISAYKVGVVLEVETSSSSKSKSSKSLTTCKVDVGDGEPLTIVTSASNVRAGSRVIVAPVGSTYLTDEGEEQPVKKVSVGGVISEGMLCDSKMLGWSGGAKGVAATLPEEDAFATGSAPPSEKPRPKDAGNGGGGEDVGPGLFEKKLTKEEKKKLAEERKKARKAKKTAEKDGAKESE